MSNPHRSNAVRGELVGISVAFEPGDVMVPAVAPPAGRRGPGPRPGRHDSLQPAAARLDAAMRPLVDLLEDASIRKIGHNLKHDLLALRRAGVALRGLDFDTMIASYVLDPGSARPRRSMRSRSAVRLPHDDARGAVRQGQGTRSRSPSAQSSGSRSTRARMSTWRCGWSAMFRPQLAELALETAVPRHRDAAHQRAGRDGMGRHPHRSRLLQRRYSRKLDAAICSSSRKRSSSWPGHEFNISSTPQLRTVLFDELKLPAVKRKTKTGAVHGCVGAGGAGRAGTPAAAPADRVPADRQAEGHVRRRAAAYW